MPALLHKCRKPNLWPPPLPRPALQIPHLGFGNLGKAGATVYIPPGTYRITKMLELTQSNVVVRGAGVSLPRSLAMGATRLPACHLSNGVPHASWALRMQCWMAGGEQACPAPSSTCSKAKQCCTSRGA